MTLKSSYVKFFFGLFIYLISIGSFSAQEQETDTTGIPFVAYWSKGDEYNFQITKVKQEWKDDALTKNDSSSYKVNFKVIDSTETSYKIHWTYEFNFGGFNIPNVLLNTLNETIPTEVIYTTNELGEFEGVENWKEIARKMETYTNGLITSLKDKADFDEKEFRTTFKPFLEIFTSKDGIEQIVLKELQYFHFPFGVEFSPTEVITYEDEIPNFIGGEPIKGNTKIFVESVDHEYSYCVLKQEMKIDPEDMRRMLVELFKQMGLGKDKENSFLDTANIDVTDQNTYEYYYFPGVPSLIETLRTAVVDLGKGTTTRVEKLRIELLWDEE